MLNAGALLLSLAAAAPRPAAPLPWWGHPLALWDKVPASARIVVLAVVGLGLLWGLGSLLWKIGRSGGRNLLMFLTGVFLVAAVGFTIGSMKLPEPVGTYFVLWHQVVRVCAAVFTTLFVIFGMALSLPWALDGVEARGMVGFVSARHIRASKSGFLTVISVLSILGVALSSFALCVVISIMGGFGADLKHKILGNHAHISLDRDNVGGFGNWDTVLEQVRLIPGVQAATPAAAGEAMASSNSNTAGVIVRGVEPETVGTVIDLVRNIEVGKFDWLKEPKLLATLPADTVIGMGPGGQQYLKGPTFRPKPDVALEAVDVVKPEDAYPGLIVGRELAKSLHVLVGDEVSLVAPLGDLGPMGVMPRTRRYRIAAIFYSGMYEYDSSHVYMLLNEAQSFLDLNGKVTNIEVKVMDAEQVTPVRDLLSKAGLADGLRVRDWKELNKNLFSALKLEKIATFIILCIAITVAAFCIICTLLLMVTEKSKEIAIMKALGASDQAVLFIFMAEGFIIGAIGTIFGVVTGWVMCEGLKGFGVRLDPEVYYVDTLPIEVNIADYGLVAVCALVITIVATLYPALSASRLRPVDGIRYE
jgi:lipoprotein-releasing system permease protein